MNDNRRKLTGILKLLYENTDAEHSMDTYQIMDALESMGHGRPDRKTIDANIKFIIEDLGFGIVKEKGKPNRYRWIEREFDLSELKALTDSINTSAFISNRKTREIIAKLKDLMSVHQAALLNRDIISRNIYKDESSTARTRDIINDSIRNHNRISFQMYGYDMYKNEVPQNDGRVLEVSPYAIIWNQGSFYMAGKPVDAPEVKSYRLDMMRNVSSVQTPAEHAPDGFSTDSYSNRVFDMFNGNITEVELNCKDRAMGGLIDVFGKDFYSERIGTDHFRARINVDVNSAFYSWIFSFGGDVIIAGPASVKNTFNKMLMDQLK